MSKIQFESESQQYTGVFDYGENCKQLCQRYNLKANHNSAKCRDKIVVTVSNYVKDTI